MNQVLRSCLETEQTKDLMKKKFSDPGNWFSPTLTKQSLYVSYSKYSSMAFKWNTRKLTLCARWEVGMKRPSLMKNNSYFVKQWCLYDGKILFFFLHFISFILTKKERSGSYSVAFLFFNPSFRGIFDITKQA